MLLDLHTDFSGGSSGGLVFNLFKKFPQFVVIHTVKGFGIVNNTEVDVFLELFCFFGDPTDVGNVYSIMIVIIIKLLGLCKAYCE